jgi:hypothetical protein
MVSRPLFTSVVLALLLVLLIGSSVQAQVSWLPPPNGIEILFSISPGKFTWWPPVGHGDELSDRGDVVAGNWQLLRNFNPPATFAPVDYGLDALQELHWGPIATTVKPMTFFSLNTGFEDAKLGPISDGDLLSDAGRIVARNKDLMARFHPMPPLQDMGLDAVFIPYYVPTTAVALPPEIWFSTTKGWFDEQLGKYISEGDLLSSRGYVVARNALLLRNFRPMPTVNADYGLDAVHVPLYRPRYAPAAYETATAMTDPSLLPMEIWFSVRKGFFDERLGVQISDGDLLSTSGRVIRTNAQLLRSFPNPTMGPVQLNYGLDAVHVRWRKLVLANPPMDTTLSKVTGNKVELVFDGSVDLPAGPMVSVVSAEGQDVTEAFDVSVATTASASDTLVLSERDGELADGVLYSIQPADGLPVEPFVLQVGKLTGDADGNGAVDVADLLSVVGSFGLAEGDAGFDPACDFNGDQNVDVVDLLTLVGNFGK